MSEREADEQASELTGLEPLHEEVEALEELPLEAESASTAEGGRRGREGGAPQKRELDRAPLELRKAAIVLMAGSILPWASVSADLSWIGSIVEKLICFLAVWIFYHSHVLKYGGKAAGFVASLGKGGPKVPMIVAGVVALVGLFPLATSGSEGLTIVKTISEKALLLLGGYTFVHIFDYEHGGKFNPMFPLLFLTAAIGGLLSIFTVIGQSGEAGAVAYVALIGTIAVTIAGCLSAHTMYVAMKEAKAHGELKRAAAADARKAAREARRKKQSGPE